jgi:hypothetical protein
MMVVPVVAQAVLVAAALVLLEDLQLVVLAQTRHLQV